MYLFWWGTGSGKPSCWGGEVLRNIVTIRVRQVGDKGLAILILARGLLGFVSLEKPWTPTITYDTPMVDTTTACQEREPKLYQNHSFHGWLHCLILHRKISVAGQVFPPNRSLLNSHRLSHRSTLSSSQPYSPSENSLFINQFFDFRLLEHMLCKGSDLDCFAHCCILKNSGWPLVSW